MGNIEKSSRLASIAILGAVALGFTSCASGIMEPAEPTPLGGSTYIEAPGYSHKVHGEALEAPIKAANHIMASSAKAAGKVITPVVLLLGGAYP